MSLCVMCSCKGDGGEETAAAGETSITTKNGKQYQADKIPADTNYDGKKVVVLYPEDRISEFDPDSTGSFVEQAIVRRNLTVESRINVDLEFISTTGGYNSKGESPFMQTLQADVQGGANSYDICSDYGMTIGSCAVNGLCVNLKDYSIVETTAPWWAPGLNEDATINGKLFFGTGDISTGYLSTMLCMFFNTDLLASNGLTNPYDMVDMDNWKWEFFIQMCKGLYSDTNGNSTADIEDTYAFGVNAVGGGDAIFYSAGNKFLETDSTGTLILSESLSNNRASNFYDVTQTFCSSGDVYVGADASENFKAGKSVFTIQFMSFAGTLVAENTGVNFGVLPLPKYDDNQDYSSVCWVGRSLYFISLGSAIPEIAATTFECLASEGYRQVTDVLYEDTYKLRYSPDEKTGEMIDLIRESIVFDLAQTYTYSFENQLPTRLIRSLSVGELAGYEMENISTVMASYGTSMKKSVEAISKVYQ